MKKRILPLLLALCLLLFGCQVQTEPPEDTVPPLELVYTRPDVDACMQILSSGCQAAQSAESLSQVLDAIDLWYSAVDSFYTGYNLAYISYCRNVKDPYWTEEYNYCMENAAQIDAGTQGLFYALAAGPWRSRLEGRQYYGPGFFDAYERENLWDQGLVALMEEESRLLEKYYAVCEAAMDVEPYSEAYFSTYGVQLEEIFIQLVGLRQQIAAYAGYDSYPQFAYDFYYYRDYSPAEAQTYLAAIADALAGLYAQVNSSSLWDSYTDVCTEQETFDFGASAASAMGGAIADAFQFLSGQQVYDIAYGENKLGISFELYLTDYQTPYIFLTPCLDPTDKLAFVHEFGHFVNDYLCGGSYAGTDVAEVHSQAMEYLSLVYGDGGEALQALKLADCLNIYVDQGAYALFEHRVYDLTGEALTAENVRALYRQIGEEFGFQSWGWDPRDYICVEHFFSHPMYIVSYVLSNDLAFQIYQNELAYPGEGLALYQACLESEESYILTFAQTFGLEDPLHTQRLEEIRKTLSDVFA